MAPVTNYFESVHDECAFFALLLRIYGLACRVSEFMFIKKKNCNLWKF